MNRSALSALVSSLVLLLMPTAVMGQPGSVNHKWKFPTTINAPWAQEADEQPLDTPTSAAGLCRSTPFDTLGAYGPLGTNVDVIVGDALNNSGFSNFGCTTPQNETTIAVNPTNPRNLIAGANDYRVCCDFTGLNDTTGWAYYSFDGGATWKNVQLPGLTAETDGNGPFKKIDSAGDPVVAFSPDGVAYYANVVFSRVSPASGIAVSVSHDGGRTWSEPNMVTFTDAANFIHDKDWLAAGPDGTVVVTWTRFNLGPRGAGFLESPIVGAISKDHGKTWNRKHFPISDEAHPFNQGSQVQFGPDGSLFVAYEAASPTTGFQTDALVLARSTNDGHSFETVELARVFDDLDCYPIYAGRQTLTDMHFRINSLPSMSVDPANGEIALVWTDNQGSGTCGGGGVGFAGTTSNQTKLLRGTWSTITSATVARITTTPEDKVFPSVANVGGKMVVSYYTRDYGLSSASPVCHLKTNPNPAGIAPVPSARSVCIDYAAKRSDDGFAAQTRLSTESSNPYIQFANGAFIGDYTQAAMSAGGPAYGSWTDFRGRPGVTPANQDVMIESFAP